MGNNDDLVRQYSEEIDRLRERREQIRANLRDYRGEDYFRACKRMQLIDQEEADMLYALGQMAKSDKIKPPPGH